MKNAGRYVEKYKNTARIPENISKHIGSYNAVKSELTENLGFEPDTHKIHEYVLKTKHPTLSGVSLKNLSRLEKEQRKTFIDQGFDSESDVGPTHKLSSRQQEVAYLIIPQLTDHERAVHEYTVGLNGRPMLKSGAIAKKMKMDISKVSKLKTAIYAKMKPFLGADDE
jgi:DNA-directed RNA polymerase sigma subunit (sigma70/sigma32)